MPMSTEKKNLPQPAASSYADQSPRKRPGAPMAFQNLEPVSQAVIAHYSFEHAPISRRDVILHIAHLLQRELNYRQATFNCSAHKSITAT